MRQSMAFDHVDCQMLNIYIYMLVAMNRVRQCVCLWSMSNPSATLTVLHFGVCSMFTLIY